MPGPLIILGRSTRAAAQSAIRAGFEPWCIDIRGDRDRQETGGAVVRICEPEQYPAGLLKLLEDAPPQAPVLITADLENHPELLDAIAFEHPLLGSSPQAIGRARQPACLTDLPAFKGLKFATTRTHSSLLHRLGRMIFGVWGNTRYLSKPRRSCAGQGITWWSPGQRLGPDHYLQQYVRGMPMSAVYWADGWSAALLGATEQLVGQPQFGADQFAYCGSLGPLQLTEKSRAALTHLGVTLTQRHDLRGLFGVDLIMDHRGNLWPIEINPRYTSSVELLERSGNIIALARGGMAQSSTTARKIRSARSTAGMCHGQAVIRAQHNTQVSDLYELFTRAQIADVPPLAHPIAAGEIICTLKTTAPTGDKCLSQLEDMAKKLYQGNRTGGTGGTGDC